jgi:L-threonylcarbamoyladenylate synthase
LTLPQAKKVSAPLGEQIEKGIQIIRRGGVLAYPTDTVYGLGAGAYHEAGVRRVFEIKKRPLSMAVPLLLADASQIHEVAAVMPAYAWRLVERFMPGALTLVVWRSQIVNDVITAGGKTVAIRIPEHPVPLALIRGSGMPLVGTSANISGSRPLLTARAVQDELSGTVDLIIDAIPPPGGIESTVVDVTGEKALIVRQGEISRERLAGVVELT